MTSIPNMISIIGEPVIAVDLCLRKVLKFREFSRVVIILDFTGRGAMMLNKHNKMSIDRKKVTWIDLADRRHPAAIFQLKQSECFDKSILKMLQLLRHLSKISIADKSISWAVAIAKELSKNGLVGIAAILKSICSPEMRRHFFESYNTPHDIGNLIKMLSWALKYPSVFCLSESPNQFRIEQHLKNKQVIWIEAKNEYFENIEHQIITGLVEIAVGKILCDENPKDISVVHLFPSSNESIIPEWIEKTKMSVKHTSVHSLYPSRALSTLQLAWIKASDSIWIPGKIRYPIAKNRHTDWLMPKEILRINKLAPGDLWMRSKTSGQFIVAKIKLPRLKKNRAHLFRINSVKQRQLIPFSQLSSAINTFIDAENKSYNLFESLCNKEMLRQGWVKVNKNTGKQSCGIDRVTSVAFNNNLENELSQLIYDLEKGTYQCRPYRQIKIPKPDGGWRTLSIPCIRDRVVQATCQLLMEPIFETVFSRFSFAYRPRRNAHQAVAIAKSLIRSGKKWVVTADVKKCFDNINHEYLLTLIAQKIGDSRFLETIRQLAEVGIIVFNDFAPLITGIPMGSPLSPLLCNIYLNPLDKHLYRSGLNFLRYADDILIFTKDFHRAEKALEILENFLIDPLMLELKSSKTNIACENDGFQYLGFFFQNNQVGIKSKKIKQIYFNLSQIIQNIGKTELSRPMEINDAIAKFNSIVRGLRNYFSFNDEKLITTQFKQLDEKITQLAQNKIDQSILTNPSWICRERFHLTQHYEDEKHSTKKALHAQGLGYNDNLFKDKIQEIQLLSDETQPIRIEERLKKSMDIEVINIKNQIFEVNKRLYILLHGCYVTISRDDLVIKKNKKEILRKPIDNYVLIYFQGFGQNVSVDFQVRATHKGTTLVLAPPISIPMTIVNSITSRTSRLRTYQVLRKNDIDVIKTGLKMLAAKVLNQASVLKYFGKYRKKQQPDIGKELNSNADRIREIGKNIILTDPCSSTVKITAMGLEGYAATIYWSSVKKLVPSQFKFVKRVKKSARDTINQCFNYAYGILYGEAWRAVTKAGLDPYFGIIHGAKKDNGSLVFDLIEEFRAPFADRLIIGLIGRGFIPKTNKEVNLLKSHAKRKIAQGFLKKWFKEFSWQSKQIAPSGIMEYQAKSLADVYLKKEKYRPFKMRW